MHIQPVPCVGRRHDKMADDKMLWQDSTAQDRQDGDFTLKRQLSANLQRNMAVFREFYHQYIIHA